MIKEICQEIERGTEVRQNLSRLRQEIKNSALKRELEEIIDNGGEFLLRELWSADPKIRKNAALLMGELANDEYLEAIIEAYKKETQLFVKSAYLTAMKYFDYTQYVELFKARIGELSELVLTEENKKHIQEEIRELTNLVTSSEGVVKHTFIGYHELSDIIILANRRHLEVTMEQLQSIPDLNTSKAKMMNAGIRIQESCLEQILPIRTYQEILFLVSGMKSCNLDPEDTAKKIVESKLLEFLEKRHQGPAPFYFRMELKSKMPVDKKSSFIKKVSAEIERISKRKLINSTSQYEFEIRLVEAKDGSYNTMVKLYTIPDERFSYRKEVIASSIKPVNAALLVMLAKDYMISDAQVLDPFCGVGTMMIERQKQVPANTSYGVDILAEAITKARVNTEAAGQIIHYINRDFFDFKHDYLFDELFTNMPFDAGNRYESNLYELYESFFDKARVHLKNHATVILYTHHREFVRELAPLYDYLVISEIEVNTKEATSLFVLTWEDR